MPAVTEKLPREQTLLDLTDYNELLPQAKLMRVAAECARDYQTADPFPHIVLDDLLPAQLLRKVVAEYDDRDGARWKQYDNPREIKLEYDDEPSLGPYTRALLHNLNASPFLQFLEKLTGVTGIIPDAHLRYGGLHQIKRGGKLGIHADFNKNVHWSLDRRVNLLVYLNEDWEEEYGGHLELWDREMQGCRQRVLPVFNRIVVFSTDRTSFHGHPDPLTCPEHRTRKSIALYYYTNGRPDEDDDSEHGTLFKVRPGERQSWKFRQAIKQFLPPILYTIAHRLRGN